MKKSAILVIALFALGCGAARSANEAFTWDLNPPDEQITQYRVYRLTGGSTHLEAIVFDPVFRPSKSGTYYVTAVNTRGESFPSKEIKL